MKSLSFLLSAVFVLSSVTCLHAVNARQGVLSVRQPDGSSLQVMMAGNECGHLVYDLQGRLMVSDEQGFYVYPDADTESEVILAVNKNLERQTAVRRGAPGLMTTFFPSTGENHALVVLVEFADNEFTVPDPGDFYNRMLNEAGYSQDDASGSARDYFIENSSGVFSPIFDVYGPVKLDRDMEYYGKNDRWGNDSNPQQMAIDACAKLDSEIDFRIYDTNGDNIIDNVFFYYAGYGEADGGGANTIWPHSTRLSLIGKTVEYDGVRLDRYACSNELQRMINPDVPDGIGTFCHEFCHVLGLPDLYATSTINLTTPGIWDLMDNGSYNNMGKTPPNLSSYERYALGWLTPDPLRYNDYSLLPLSESNRAIIHEGSTPNEYFLFENRQQKGFDAYLPNHGMLVWHIDYRKSVWDSNTVNDNIWHQCVDLVEADNNSDLNTKSGDSFPGSANVTKFTKWTSPSFSFWDYSDINIGIWHIRESTEGTISFSALPLSYVEPEEDEEESSVGSVYEAVLPFRVDGNCVSGLEGILEIFDIGGKKVRTLPAGCSVVLPKGLYLAVKDGFRYKILI